MMKPLFLTAGLFGLGLLPALSQSATPPGVGVFTAAEQPVYGEQSYVGRIQSPLVVQLDARVVGYLQEKDFKDGDSVFRGQLLYVIEQPPYQAAVAQAQAAVDQARAQSRNATLTLGRAQALLNTPAGLPSSVDSSRAAALSGGAQIASAMAQLQVAQIDLGYTEIRAPIDGRIGATNVDVGNVVGPTSGPLATVVSEDPVWVTFALPVLDVLKLRDATAPGGFSAVELVVKLPDGRIYGQTTGIDFVDNRITPTTDTLNLRGTIANPPLPGAGNTGRRELQDGEFINVILRDRLPQQQIAVPQRAVVADQLGDYVWVVGPDDVVRRQNVTLGQSTPASVAVATGLRAGDRVVIDGIDKVRSGGKVQPRPAANATPPASGED